MKNLKERLEDVNPFADFEEFKSIKDDYEAYYRENLTDEAIDNGVVMELDTRKALVTKSTRDGVNYQVTYFDRDGEPVSHKDIVEIEYRKIPLGYEFKGTL